MTNKPCYTASKWDTFVTCPRQYKAKYITKEVEFKPTPESLYGDEVHDAMERCIKEGGELPKRFARYQKFLDAIRNRPGTPIAEGNIAVDDEWNPVGYFDKSARWRSKIDVLVDNGSVAEVFDWKTGKRKDKSDQLHIYGAMVLASDRRIEAVRTGYVWLKEGVVSPPMLMRREDMPKIIDKWDERAETLDRAAEVDHFPPKPSGLCHGWCDVTDYEFWKPKRRR